jgi:EmrB/QacA subfamily drug resistance transporter
VSFTAPDPRRWWALAIIAVAQFVVIMDTSIIGVALPEIQRALGFSPSGLSWVFNAYVIAFGGLLLLGGRLSDLYGARRVFIAGFAILGVASLVTGLATSDGILLLGRAAQGVGSALIAPAALTLLMVLFSHDAKELTKALALYGAAAPAGGTAGVFLGGLLTEAADWRWVFFVNVPIAVAVLVAATRILPTPGARRGSLDLAGALTVTGALSLAVFAIVRAAEIGFAAPATLLALAASIVLFVLFLAIQARRREPLMPLSIWRARDLAAANLSMALLGAAWVPAWFFLNLFLQDVLKLGAFEGGAALLPMTGLIMVLMVAVTPRVVARFGYKSTLVGGMLVLAGGIGWLSLAGPGSSYLVGILPATLIAATGMAMAYIPAMLGALSGARPDEGGLAAGIVNTTYQVGSALGLAVVTVIATTGAGTGFTFLAAAAIALVGAVLAAATLRGPARAEAREASGQTGRQERLAA